MTQSLDALIERLEKLEGADRGVDGLIARDVDGWVPHFDLEGDRLLEWHDFGGHWHRAGTHPKGAACKARSDSYPGFERECPSYTASLDAALALVARVLPGWGFHFGSNIDDTFHAEVEHRMAPGTASVADAKTPAIALYLATLQALRKEKR